MYGNPLPFTAKGQRIRDRRIKATYEDGVPYVIHFLVIDRGENLELGAAVVDTAYPVRPLLIANRIDHKRVSVPPAHGVRTK